jgi:alanine racemase
MGRVSSKKSKMRFTDVLVYTQGFIGVAFVFAVCINSAGMGLTTDTQCYNVIRVCIAMYGVGKMAL